MNLFENILLDTILILFPLLLFILYDVYKKVYDLEKGELFLDFALMSGFYLVLKYKSTGYDFPYLLMNIPLFVAYLKNRNISILFLSIFCSLSLNSRYDMIPILVILEYLSYFIIYKIAIGRKKILIFVNQFIFLKVLFYLIYEGIDKPYTRNNLLYFNRSLITILSFIIVIYLIYILIKKSKELLSFNNDSTELQKEKDLRMSLFKITHEIKNPITVCKGYLDMFDVEDQVKSRKYIEIIKSEIDRVLLLLEDFLSINKIKIEKDIIDLNMLLEEVSNNFTPILREKNIKKSFIISKDELYINADYNRLNQVLINVIKNSIESIETKGVKGIIKLYTKINKTNIKIYIEDNGVGMTEEELNKMFEPFFTTKKRGTGLGVYLSKQIMDAHKGEIIYKSKEGEGTTVIVKLPYQEIKI